MDTTTTQAPATDRARGKQTATELPTMAHTLNPVMLAALSQLGDEHAIEGDVHYGYLMETGRVSRARISIAWHQTDALFAYFDSDAIDLSQDDQGEYEHVLWIAAHMTAYDHSSYFSL